MTTHISPMASTIKQFPSTSFNPQPLQSVFHGFRTKPTQTSVAASLRKAPHLLSYSPPLPSHNFNFQNSFVPLSACLAILLCSSPANAGFLSGSTGIESVPGPELPQIDFLNRWNDDNQKRYAELDAKFKDSPLLKQLLEKSKQNKEKNKKSIEDKYCLRGAEWGVGDCSTAGMTPEERDSFIAMLKQKAGVE
ncbi:uncharacterized protein LOC107778107 [Nicotiana tabacum]|uniref:Uncharacterized protein LOC107778107 n=1 Tax=Nicotiana tabacum TaxID=4097 RepID=A0A1S3YNE9_TOBAC|nr:uncharacterized protein LOC104111106 [Nicotiana tomentosiformis]XP_016453789.1 PREDICTED: uncharacterized protein LOC107778107 [Nicotiana tabacum]